MTKDDVLECILKTNIRTEKMFYDTFRKLFGYDPERTTRLSLSDMMHFVQAWNETDAYSYARDVLREMRKDGYDVKMDMQSYKLSYHGRIEND